MRSRPSNYFSWDKGEKYCSAGDHVVRLKQFRKSSKADRLEPCDPGYYLSHCKSCESDYAKIRQSFKTGYKFQTHSITQETKERLLKRMREHGRNGRTNTKATRLAGHSTSNREA